MDWGFILHVLELAATFVVGAWTGSSHCRFAISLETDEHRKDSWLDRLCCAPRRLSSPASSSSKSSDSPTK
jgi:hypothetical protein